MLSTSTRSQVPLWVLAAALVIAAMVYWPGLQGGFLFDDYPNIVDNQGVQPQDNSVPSLVRAALSSPSSDFKRPLASLSFAANYLTTGLDPFWMKLTNLIIHLLNGLLVFVLARLLLQAAHARAHPACDVAGIGEPSSTESDARDQHRRKGMVAALIAASWMLLPINLTGVLYVVQRMESMANLFVLLGMIGYVVGRRHMLKPDNADPSAACNRIGHGRIPVSSRGFLLCLVSVTLPTAVGILAKETAVMLPLYALLVEWALFHFVKPAHVRDRRIVTLFLLVLMLPMILGVAWLLPGLMNPARWATRDFTMITRLLSEARIIVDYIAWTLLPTPDALSFYHDDFRISSGLLTPWTTLLSIIFLGALIALMFRVRRRQPLISLGIALFCGCQLLTGTILPLELIYEHRNYFASFGLLLAVVPLLAVPQASPYALPRNVLLAGLLLCWTALTAITAQAWSSPLRLAEDLAARATQSPRAQYELGRTYIIYSHYEPASPFTKLAYAPLERAAALRGASILPEQALIFMNARMQLPIKDVWWNSLIAKLRARKLTIQDESSLGALTRCAREGRCDLPHGRMVEAFTAALAHPDPGAGLLATYGDYAWNVLDDHALGLRVTEEAVGVEPDEPAYRITLVRMLVASGENVKAEAQLRELEQLNIGGRLNEDLAKLKLIFKH